MEREIKIKELREKGWSWGAIGVHFGISRSRAHQIGSGYKYENFNHSEIFERDYFLCQFPSCDRTSKSLIVHHLDHNDRNNEITNLITLCVKCHQYYHRYKPKFCIFCNKEYSGQGKYCSINCKKSFWAKKKTINCLWCGKEFISKHKTKCCGLSCRSKLFWKIKHDKTMT